MLVNGDAERLRLLLSNGLPVLIETWLIPEPNDGMGHYRLLTGYDDAAQEWIAYDAYVSAGLKQGEPYAGIRLPYAETAALWQVFNRPYLLVYTRRKSQLVASILGGCRGWRADVAASRARKPRQEIAATILTTPSPGSISATRSWRWHVTTRPPPPMTRHGCWACPGGCCGTSSGHSGRISRPGRFQEVLALADCHPAPRPTRSKNCTIWQGQALLGAGRGAAAQASFRRALEINPNYRPAADALARVRRQAA